MYIINRMRALPQGSGYPLYLFWFFKKPKKDAAAIPNAAKKIIYKQRDEIIVFIRKPCQNSII